MNLKPESSVIQCRRHGLEGRLPAVGSRPAQTRDDLLAPGRGVRRARHRGAKAQDVTRDEVEHALRQGLLEVWFPILDRENGGFLCDFDYEWKPAGRQPKSIVFQARSTWLAARAAEQLPAGPARISRRQSTDSNSLTARCGTPSAAGGTGSSTGRGKSRLIRRM